MIDIIGAISLTAIFGLCCAVLVGAAPVETASRMRLSALALAWFAAVAVFGAIGVFSAAGIGTPLIGVAVLTPVVVFLFSAARSPPCGTWHCTLHSRRSLVFTPLAY